MAAQYWRAVALKSYDGLTLRLSEFQLFYLGNRIDILGTLSSSVAPDVGALANLSDDNLSTTAEWSGSYARGDLVLQWAFSSAVDIDDICVGSAEGLSSFLMSVGIQYASSPAGPWTELRTYNNLWMPGAYTKTVSGPTCVFDPIGTLQAGGWAFTWNSLTADRMQFSAATGGAAIRGTTMRTAGVLQFEMDMAWVATPPAAIGVQVVSQSAANTNLGWYLTPGTGAKWANGTQTAGYCTAFGSSGSFTVGVVVDFTAGSITFYKNGVSLGVAYTGLALSAGTFPVASPSSVINGVSLTAIIRTSGFVYPISGATPWDITTSAFTLWKTFGVPNGVTRGQAVVQWNQPTPRPVAGGAPLPYLRAHSIGTYMPLNWWEDDNRAGNSIYNNTWGNITGVVTVAGVPAKRRVRLFRDIDSQCFGEQWSDPVTGAVTFAELPKKWKFTGVAEDYTGTYQWQVWNSVYPA